MVIKKDSNLSYLIDDGTSVIEVKSLREWADGDEKLYNRLKVQMGWYDVYKFKSPMVIITRLVDGVLPKEGAKIKYGRMNWFVCRCGNGYRKDKNKRFIKATDHCEECHGVYQDVGYTEEIRRLTSAYRMLIPGIEKVTDEKGKMINGYVIDHIVPIWFGYKADISIYRMARIDNLQIMSYEDNNFTCKSGMLPEVWRNYLTGKIWVYSYFGDEDVDLYSLCVRKSLDYVSVCSKVISNQWPIVINDIELVSFSERDATEKEIADFKIYWAIKSNERFHVER